MPAEKDHWWEIDPRTDVLRVADEVQSNVRERVLPWFDAQASVPPIAKALQPQPSILAAAAALAAGDRPAATERIKRMIASRPWASAHVVSWARGQGLEVDTPAAGPTPP